MHRTECDPSKLFSTACWKQGILPKILEGCISSHLQELIPHPVYIDNPVPLGPYGMVPVLFSQLRLGEQFAQNQPVSLMTKWRIWTLEFLQFKSGTLTGKYQTNSLDGNNLPSFQRQCGIAHTVLDPGQGGQSLNPSETSSQPPFLSLTHLITLQGGSGGGGGAQPS